MHGYCVGESNESRKKEIIGALVIASVLITPALNWYINKAVAYAELNIHIKAVLEWVTSNGFSFSLSYVAVFGVLFGMLNWGFSIWPISALVGVPSVRGRWKGNLHSNFAGGTDIEMTLIVKQSWMGIQCTAIFPKSSSNSIMACVYRRNGEEIRLEFAYHNESQDGNVKQESYYGFNYFTIRGDSMTGKYFTNREGSPGVQTHGFMELTKQHCWLWHMLQDKRSKNRAV